MDLDASQAIILNLLRGIYRACTLPSTTTHGQTASASSRGGEADSADTNTSHLYTLSVCLLILIQDSMLFPRYANEVVTLPWYKERASSVRIEWSLYFCLIMIYL